MNDLRRSNLNRIWLAVWLGVCFQAAVAMGQDPATQVKSEKQIAQKTQTDEKKKPSQTQIIIPARDHQVGWAAIIDAIVQEAGVQVPALATLPAQGVIDLKRRGTRWSIFGLNLAMRPAVKIRIGRKSNSVVVEIDHEKVALLRKRLGLDLTPGPLSPTEEAKYRILAFDPKESLADADRIAIVIHGFNSDPSQMKTLCKSIQERKNKICVATFHYPSRAGVEAAAKRLHRELKGVLAENPKAEISLVTHSTGGLVARYVVEAPEFDLDPVKRLIMIAPPNGGTVLATLPAGRDHFGSKYFEETIARIDRPKIREAVRSLVGEYNAAIEDLRPGSELLEKLNRFEREPKIKYSILLGKRAVLTGAQAATLQGFAKSVRTDRGEAQQIAREVSALLQTLSGELVSPQGDGVVSVKSGTLKGVEDITIESFLHRDLSRDGTESQKRILRWVHDRLQSD